MPDRGPSEVELALNAETERAEQAEAALREVEPLLDAQFVGHDGIEEFMEKARKLNEALDLVRAALAPPEEKQTCDCGAPADRCGCEYEEEQIAPPEEKQP